ncbi:MAG: D-alanyl-D-alanine carboxypeptidase [Clostridia bacterium]|nr:D-alanyl-D-alanine carboxypeptidase [Clostridia bacterium]
MRKRKTSLFFRAFCLLLCFAFLPFSAQADTFDMAEEAPIAAETVSEGFAVEAKSAVLMEEKTGKVLYAQNENEALPPASVTKVMTLLLIMEAIDGGKIGWQDQVTVSERAASMGGSQIFLKVGEVMSVEDLLKSVVIASANDAALALAEYVMGSEEAFVAAMNQKAKDLGLQATVFENTNGLDDTVKNHVTSALDIAVMSRELISHKDILKYSSVWMDTVRNGAFTLTNTNRLIRFYPGATGLKTGSTAKAGFCITATAERNGMTLIAVVMGAETRDKRNAETKKLLDYGFARYGMYKDETGCTETLPLKGGISRGLPLTAEPFCTVLPKESLAKVQSCRELPEYVSAPIQKGTEIGKIVYTVDGEKVGESRILAKETVEEMTFSAMLLKLLQNMTLFTRSV